MPIQMFKRAFFFIGLAIAALLLLRAQNQPDIRISYTGGAIPALAVPDLRGAGGAQSYMAAFNRTLWDDVEGSGFFRMAPKTMYPLAIPQQPPDFQQDAGAARGLRLADWSGPPVSADYLACGYAAVQNGVLVLYGWVFDAKRDTAANAQVFGKRYLGSPDEAGARKTAHEFAADIVSMLGGRSVFGTHIYFTSDRTGHKEIWAMDADGSNQRQITRFNFIAQYPAVSPDGSKIAFTVWPAPGETPRICVYSTNPVRDLRFYNQRSGVNGTPSFTPDGLRIVYMSGVEKAHRIFVADLDGSNFRPVTFSDSDDAEPKVNPKTGTDIVFSSGRSGPEQVYRANMDGTSVERLTDGTGEASNPAWHPNGQMIAFAWTRGYRAVKFNIFSMEVASRKYDQLTHDEGKNENPSWDPGGTQIAFGSNRTAKFQIWTMLANGTRLRQLTTLGNNTNPVWGR